MHNKRKRFTIYKKKLQRHVSEYLSLTDKKSSHSTSERTWNYYFWSHASEFYFTHMLRMLRRISQSHYMYNNLELNGSNERPTCGWSLLSLTVTILVHAMTYLPIEREQATSIQQEAFAFPTVKPWWSPYRTTSVKWYYNDHQQPL